MTNMEFLYKHIRDSAIDTWTSWETQEVYETIVNNYSYLREKYGN